MSNSRDNDVKGDEPEKEIRPLRRDTHSKYVPTLVEDEDYWDDEYGDLESFEKMPKSRNKNEWR